MNDTVTMKTESGGSRVFVEDTAYDGDEPKTMWFIFTEDGKGNFAVNREDGQKAAIVNTSFGDPTLYLKSDGATFGVNNQDEFIVDGDQWIENTK